MRILKTKIFNQWAKKTTLQDAELKKAVQEMRQGQYEASLGGYLYKKRIALQGKGKRSGIRTIIAFKKDMNVFFVYGFSKNVRNNINEEEKQSLKKLAKIYFSYNEIQINKAIKINEFIEVK